MLQKIGVLALAACCALSASSAHSANTTAHVERSVLQMARSGFQECPTAPATPEDRRDDKSVLKFATYNAEFLFLVGYGQLQCPGSDCKWTTVSEAQSHVKQIAKNIVSINADIVQLNEVEDCAVLRMLVAEIAALGDNSYRPYLVRGEDASTGQNSALITRIDPAEDLYHSDVKVELPVENSKCPPASKFSKSKGVSKHFRTSFNVEGFSKPITLIGAHLLANPQHKGRCYEREGQATVLSGLATDALEQDHHVIMSGDFNDFSLSATDKNDNRPISNALGIMEGPGFVNAGKFAAKAQRYTQWWDKNKDCVFEPTEVSTLDHVILSETLTSSVKSVEYRTDLYEVSCGGFNSDHFPITVTFEPEH
ncbi:hypothetical protein ATCC90586_005569 [Pythium insidiosum]|nr:hypothetical protein ATCC90586_005569 [Pythium insidiosum]